MNNLICKWFDYFSNFRWVPLELIFDDVSACCGSTFAMLFSVGLVNKIRMHVVSIEDVSVDFRNQRLRCHGDLRMAHFIQGKCHRVRYWFIFFTLINKEHISRRNLRLAAHLKWIYSIIYRGGWNDRFRVENYSQKVLKRFIFSFI